MARDRPPPNWSGSSNPDRDFEGRERDGWSTDDSAHDGHVPNVADFGPETNAFLWALEGEPDPFADSPAPQFTGSVEQVNTGIVQSRADFYDEDDFVDDGQPAEQGQYFAEDLGNREPPEPYYQSENGFVDRPRGDNVNQLQRPDQRSNLDENNGVDPRYQIGQTQFYDEPYPSHEVPSSRGGFDDGATEEPVEHVEMFDPATSAQFSNEDYDFSHEYSEEQLRLPAFENIDPPHHRQNDEWFDQNNIREPEISQFRSDNSEDLGDYRAGIQRDVVSEDTNSVQYPAADKLRHDNDYYDDYEEELYEPDRRQRPSRPRRRPRQPKDGYVVESKSKSHKIRDQLIEILFLVVPTIILVLLVRSFVVSPFLVPTPSMEPTLEIGDRVLVNKLSYRVGDVSRGDIVVVQLDTEEGEKVIIKRAIGLPGETVEIRNNQVIINGKLALEESDYLEDDAVNADFGPVRIPPDELFLLGDNREVSDDSSKELGPVPVDRVVGRAFVRFWPMGRFGSL